MSALTRDRPQTSGPPQHDNVFSPDLAVFKLVPGEGADLQLGLVNALAVAQRMRDAVLAHGDRLPRRVQALLSGHGPDGGPLQHPHLAVLPLTSAERPHAAGRIAGIALALPRDVRADDRRQVLRAAGRIRRLVLGRLGVWSVVPRAGSGDAVRAWTAFPGGATQWATVTPLVYDVHPRAAGEDAQRQEVAAMIARACAHAGLPTPREIIATQTSAHLGTPPAHAFPRLRRKDGGERRHAHAIVTFDRPVMGPLLLGAGRYRGYGLLRPLPGPEARSP
jgi:CRISPR-associated protein Csb2